MLGIVEINGGEEVVEQELAAQEVAAQEMVAQRVRLTPGAGERQEEGQDAAGTGVFPHSSGAILRNRPVGVGPRELCTLRESGRENGPAMR